MSEGSLLPAVQESGILRLDELARQALKEKDYDSRVIDTVQELGKVGIKFTRDATPGYVMAVLLQRNETLRATEQEFADLVKEARKERAQLKKKAKAIEDDPLKRDEHKALCASIDKLSSDISGYAASQVRLSETGSKNSDSILRLYGKTREPGPSDDGGNVSWNPDEPVGVVNLQINNGNKPSVSIEGA